MSKIWARIVSHPSGNLTFQTKQPYTKDWTDILIGFITTPSDNDDFIERVNTVLTDYMNNGVEVIWVP